MSIELANRIDEVCDAFESAILAGESISVEQASTGWVEPDRSKLIAELEQIASEFELDQPVGNEKPVATNPATHLVGFQTQSRGKPGEDGSLLGVPPRYKVISPLGEGGMGQVYRVLDQELGREVALKNPHQNLIHDQQARARFIREARAMARVRHPNVCQIHDGGEHNGVPYMTMELVDGLALSDRLRDGCLAPTVCAEVCQKIALGLSAVHKAKIIHRDIKPANIMMRGDEPVLMDLGLAGHLDEQSLTVTGAIIGTVIYMSPEQVDGEQADERSDIYGLGALLYHMLTGEPPFDGKFSEVMYQIVHSDVKKPSTVNNSVPQALDAICIKAMAKDRHGRFQSAGDMVTALTDFLEPISHHNSDCKTTALAEPALSRFRKFIRRRAVSCLVAGCAVLASLILVLKTGGGRWTITGLPEDATVIVDGDRKHVEIRDGNASLLLSVGDHSIVVKSAGQSMSRELKIEWRGSEKSTAIAPSSIQGRLWEDTDGDGVWDEGREKPLGGQRVFIDKNANGKFDRDEEFAITDKDGMYTLRQLPAGYHEVTVDLDTDSRITNPPPLYKSSFTTDPEWQSSDSEKLYWAKESGVLSVEQSNTRRGGKAYYYDTKAAHGSFLLKYDVLIEQIDSGASIPFGVFDRDMNTSDNGSYICLSFAPTPPARLLLEARDEADALLYDYSQAVFETGVWYTVEITCDVARSAIHAEIRPRNVEQHLAQIELANVGRFSTDMSRIGTSKIREGSYAPGLEGRKARARVDNVEFVLMDRASRRVSLGFETDAQADFGIQQVRSVSGSVWRDANRNGIKEIDEAPSVDTTVYLDSNLNGQPDTDEFSQKTDEKGAYEFLRVPARMHVVRCVIPEGTSASIPKSPEWLEYRGSIYAASPHGKWDECRLHAAAAGAHLAAIADKEENDWLADNFGECYARGHKDDPWFRYVWIGLERENDSWHWQNGENVKFVAKWWNGEPYTGPNTQYAALNVGKNPSKGVWSNSDCSAIARNPQGVMERPKTMIESDVGRFLDLRTTSQSKVDFAYSQTR